MKKEIDKFVNLSSYMSNKFILNFIKQKQVVERDYLLLRADLLGDFFVFFPFFLKYIKKFKNHLFLINSLHEPIVKKYTKDYVVLDPKKYRLNLIYKINVLKLISKFRFNYAINLIPHRHPKIVDEIISVCNSNNKICYVGDDININNSTYFYNQFYNLKIPFSSKNKYYNKKYQHIFKHENTIYHYLCKKKVERKKVKELYFKAFTDLKKKLIKNKYNYFNYICLVTDSSAPYRRYPRKKWQKILNNLPKDIKIIQIGLNNFPLDHPNLTDLTGKTTLEEAISIIMNASLVIGNETGLTHLAYLSNIPTVCILGGGHFGRFLPWAEFKDLVKCVYHNMSCFQCCWKCKYVNLKKGIIPPCISNIESKKVVEAINELNKQYEIF